MKKCYPLVLGLLCLTATALPAGPPSKKDPPVKPTPAKQPEAPLTSVLVGPAVITDFSGKEHNIKDWRFTVGTMQLPWLNGGKGAEVLEISEGKKPPLKKRVLTLIPIETVRSLEFDHAKHLVTVKVATAADSEETLTGMTGYIATNIFALEAQADLGELGKATTKFQGGVVRGVKSIRFPNAKPAAALPMGRPAELRSTADAKEIHKIVDLQPLYRKGDGTLFLDMHLHFQPAVKLDVAKVQKLSQVGNGSNQGLVYDVTLKSGPHNPLVLVELVKGEGQPASALQGLLGRCTVGYKLVPPSTLAELVYEGALPAVVEPPAPKK